MEQLRSRLAMYEGRAVNGLPMVNTPRQASEMLIEKAAERSQSKGGNCSMAIVKLVKPAPDAGNYMVQPLKRAI